MEKINNKYLIPPLLILIGVFLNSPSQAAFNPFKKDINLSFGEKTPWKFRNNEAIKSGQNKDRNNINYYHLRINNKRILLRLGKNDPAGKMGNTRELDALDVIDVLIDGQRMPLFQWCMNNRTTQKDNKVFRSGTMVKNGMCTNSDGDVLIKLDDNARRILSQGKALQFMLKPYKTMESLSYDLRGLPPMMKRMARSAKPRPVAKKIVRKKAVKNKTVRKPKAKKPIRLCYVKSPIEYKTKIRPTTYPCNNAARKAAAEKRMQDQLQIEKQKEAIVLEHKRAEDTRKKAESEMKQRSKKWESMQNSMWIGRCKKYWESGVSPCFCRRVISQAPAGIVDTCKK